MAYTYEQFESAASKAGLLNKFSKQDLVIAQSNPEYGISMLQLMKDRSGAKTSEQRLLANEAVRQLRRTYGGYTSAGRLPEYTDEVIQQTDNYYAGQNAYRRALAEAEGYGSTAYDKTLGDIYSRQSALERERARADALATTSAATGGRPSSYAITAAQQAAGNQDARLDNTLLGLRQNAYQQALKAAGTTKPEPDTKVPYDPSTPIEPEKTPDKEPEKEPVEDAFTPDGTTAAERYAKSIDGNIAIRKNMGWSNSQIRDYILSCLNNDDLFGEFSDAEFAWLMEYFADYNLV